MKANSLRILGALVALTFASVEADASATVPACRLDHTNKALVGATVQRAIDLYAAEGIELPLDKFIVNPVSVAATPRVLVLYIIEDAGEQGVDAQGCRNGKMPIGEDERLDALSVHNGCLVRGANALELRCSAQAISIFSERGQRADRENPSLLYVLSHELAHVHQRRTGEYSGRTDRIRLSAEPREKLRTLQQYCAPALLTKEREADMYALRVIDRALTAKPYREPVLSERGSLLWNVDLLALAADRWQQESTMRELLTQPKVHSAFAPTELPTPRDQVRAKARQFVCDVMTARSGDVAYPSRSGTHPSAAERLRSIAEKIKTSAERLPSTGGSEDFEPIAKLQNDLSAVFLHMYREQGVYMEAVEDEICTIVNSSDPIPSCPVGK